MSTNINNWVPSKIFHSNAATWLAKRFYDLRNHRLEKLFFTVTTGRSGTMTLTELFKAAPQSLAYHEPYPIMNGEWLWRASYGRQSEVDEYYKTVKSIYIRRGALGARYYLEANHLFLKTFIGPAIEEFGNKLEIIHLVRPALEVASSIYRIGNWPGTEDGNTWWLDYKAKNNVLQVSDILDNDAEYAHPFYKALWYWYETEARIAHWKRFAPHIKFHRFETYWFNDRVKVTELMNNLGVSYSTELLEKKTGKKVNDIQTKKGKEGLGAREELEMQLQFEQLLKARDLLFTKEK